MNEHTPDNSKNLAQVAQTATGVTLRESPNWKPYAKPMLAALVIPLILTAIAGVVIFRGLDSEPFFDDESAMIAQSYYYTLIKSLSWNHPDWIHPAASDHPPLPKIFFGLFLDLAGKPVPSSLDPWLRWQLGDHSPPSDPAVLYWARVPSAVFGVLGVLAIYCLGLQVRSRALGLVSALFLLSNPLYLAHSRRAMSDSFTEAMVISSIALVVWACRRLWHGDMSWKGWVAYSVAQSLICGAAALAKLNGGVSTAIVLAALLLVTVTSLIGRCPGIVRRLATVLFVVVFVAGGSFAIFVAFNPFLTADPTSGAGAPHWLKQQKLIIGNPDILSRAQYLVRERSERSEAAARLPQFQKDWISSPWHRMEMMWSEGMGRYGLFGPRDIRTKEPRPDVESFGEYGRAWSLVWGPMCIFGIWVAAASGWKSLRKRELPRGWFALLYGITMVLIVAVLIPLNWDRYYLPIQPCMALFGSIAVVQIIGHIMSGLILQPPNSAGQSEKKREGDQESD